MSSSKRRLVEVKDILTWTETFTIYQMVLCAVYPQHWLDLTKYKLLIIQTARQYPGQAWLEYNLAFRTDAAATGLADWSKMNSDFCFSHHLAQAPPPHQVRSAALQHHFVILGTRVVAPGPLVNVATSMSASGV